MQWPDPPVLLFPGPKPSPFPSLSLFSMNEVEGFGPGPEPSGLLSMGSRVCQIREDESRQDPLAAD